MKKIANILLLMGVLLMALSCIETEGLNENPEGEITMSPVLSHMARTRAEGTSSPYPDGRSFGVFAYYNGTQPYFENHKFISEDGLCTGDVPVYWPLSGSLFFAGYSPFDEHSTADFSVANRTLSITNYLIDGKKDLMYFLPQVSDGGEYVSYDKSKESVEVVFQHALSCVAFTVRAGQGGGKVKLKQIKLNSVPQEGDFSVQVGQTSGVWANTSSSADLIVWEESDGKVLSTDDALYAEAFIIPGAASLVTVTYQIGTEQAQSKTFTPEDDWSIGTKNIYDVTIDSMGELIISPSASISHIYESDILKGTEVTVNLGDDLTKDDLNRIKQLSIEVYSNGTVYKSYSLDSDKTLDTCVVKFSTGNLKYIPQGEYSVKVRYYDGVTTHDLDGVKAVSLAPEYSVSLSNSRNGRKITVNASVSISDEVLQECHITNCKVTISGTNGVTWNVGDANTNDNNFISSKVFEGKWETTYTLSSIVLFDKVQKSASTTSVTTTATSFTMGSNAISTMSELQDGEFYCIRLKNGVSGAPSMWYNTTSGGFVLTNGLKAGSSYGISINRGHTFQFHENSSYGTHSGYSYTRAGTWKSLGTGKFLRWSNSEVLVFDAADENSAYNLMMCNHWKTDSAADKNQFADIYKANNLSGNMLGRDGSTAKFNSYSDSGERKWEIIPVILQ